ncbi:hypothetical protein T07_6790 [Trichinella nelsoni]|uniref:Uncharacterized protein n=1 Tax=Trichinella nelsoni TaxID=6336 RepID=A0A0V0RFR9_9BILA|nr:hypothetical protein T07_6790 [Trichinella nelsoni]
MDDNCTREKGFVKRSTAYRVQHAQVAAFKGRLLRNEISVERFFKCHSDSEIRPAIFDITGDPKKTEGANLAPAS